ncbi:glutamyl-tRNA synthetase [Anaplasma phagocytophilum str. MRK]|uniref:glutamate--tRNA ligase n=1 Tax=Anaplasma phagocytophilum TaxID=948 RepID=UPI000533A936|nr:glutamate--tRNA ligase [Anaplasma phagocytophilum]KDB56455.1 glutamyl-tRNA synthetase [Anaplasma phagocytophilum str. MRK]
MITRFAPSPTGYMHVGNARTALICWLYARSKSGKFLLRIDDTDASRSEHKYIEGIKQDLDWLALDWDSCFQQSTRLERYQEVFDLLLDQGVIYPCYETQEELDMKRSMMLKMGLPPIYDRSALKMTEQERQACSGRLPYFRLKIDQSREITWEDEVRGRVSFQAKNISDPIIKRTDGTYTYMFPSVVDDIDFAITHIIRGEDHVSNTATQICIFDILKAKVPVFVHLPLVHFRDAKISKRVGSDDIEIRHLRDIGMEPMAIKSYLARMGTSLPVEPQENHDVLVESFDIRTFNQAPIKFSLDDISRLNSRIVQCLSFDKVKDRFVQQGLECTEEFWYLIRDNVNTVEDVREWINICNSQITTAIDDKDRTFISEAKALLPDTGLDEEVCKAWLQRIKETSNRSTRDVLLPLRLATTGVTTGPGLAQLLPFIGRAEVVRRLECASKGHNAN